MTLTAAVAAVDNNSKAAVADDNNSTSDGTSDGKTVTATTVTATVTATSEQNSIGGCIIWGVVFLSSAGLSLHHEFFFFS